MQTNSSKILYERAAKVLVEGVSSASRGPAAFGDYPPYMRRAEGARMWDVDGNEYIDWMLAFGALPMGHAHPKIVDAVRAEIANGAHLATALEIEVEVAEMLVGMLPHADRVRFANTGTEAIMTAIRLARGLTGRKKIIKFEGHYHGWFDAVLLNTNPQPLTSLGHRFDPVRIPDSSGLTLGSWEDTVVVPWNDPDALERAMENHGRETACVLTEGVMANAGVIPPRPGFLQRIVELCKQFGALFCLDETVTGFRVSAGGCAELYGLRPDITTYGKGMGQGFPMAAIAGPSHVMEGLEWGKVMHFGTHNASRLGLFVTRCMLTEMLSDNRAGFKKLKETGEAIAHSIRTVARRQARHKLIVQNVGSIFQIFFTERESIDDFRDYCAYVDRLKFREFVRLLHGKGIFMNPSNGLHSVSCLAHTQADILTTTEKIGEALDEL